MSSDNYYTIRRDGDKYVAVMGFMSDLEDGRPAVMRDRHSRFDSWDEAVEYAMSEYSEYGLIKDDALEGDTNAN